MSSTTTAIHWWFERNVDPGEPGAPPRFVPGTEEQS